MSAKKKTNKLKRTKAKPKYECKAILTGAVLNELPAGIAIINRDMRIQWVNIAHERWFGSLQETVGKYCFNVYKNQKIACSNCPVKKAFGLKKAIQSIQNHYIQNGEKRCFELSVSPIKDRKGSVIQVILMFSDATRKKRECEEKKEKILELNNICSTFVKTNKKLESVVSKLEKENEKTSELNDSLKKKYKVRESELKIVKEELQDVFKVSSAAVSPSKDLNDTLSMIVKVSSNATHADAISLRLIKEKNNSLITVASSGLSKEYLADTFFEVGKGFPGVMVNTKKPLVINDLKLDSQLAKQEGMIKEGIRSIIYIPAVFRKDTLGIITAYFKSSKDFNENEIQLLSNFASQAAVAIEEAKLYKDVHVNYFNTVRSLVLAMEAKDTYTKRHSERTTQFAIKLGKYLKLSDKQIQTLTYAGKVHDVGKIAISDVILNKPGKLTMAERGLIELHPIKGAEMLSPLSFLEDGIPCVRHHHERWDGRGYPDGLKKSQIPFYARVLACADSFDAMTSDRPYRFRKMTYDEALGELKANSGAQFDPAIVSAFEQVLRSET